MQDFPVPLQDEVHALPDVDALGDVRAFRQAVEQFNLPGQQGEGDAHAVAGHMGLRFERVAPLVSPGSGGPHPGGRDDTN